MSIRTEGGCVPDGRQFRPLARSPIAPAPPVTELAGWEVSGRRAIDPAAGGAGLTVTDCTPLAKVQFRAPAGGQAAAAIGVRFGRTAPGPDGTLIAGSGPGEWLVLAAPGQAGDVAARLGQLAGQPAGGEHVSWTDLTHGRALMRLSGELAVSVLSRLCGADLSDDMTPDGAAFRAPVAALATDLIRDDLAGRRSYLLHCERSSGAYLFSALLRAGAGFGIETDGFRLPSAAPWAAAPG
jgi:heterotetrameric sarcosine oxidase gamma subunit